MTIDKAQTKGKQGTLLVRPKAPYASPVINTCSPEEMPFTTFDILLEVEVIIQQIIELATDKPRRVSEAKLRTGVRGATRA